jgi:hypothetical protein
MLNITFITDLLELTGNTGMLSNHMVRSEIRGVSSKMMVRRGCPQGGVLSPFLWKLVINALLRPLNNGLKDLRMTL